jgi:ABC-2 type transport system permease protein
MISVLLRISRTALRRDRVAQAMIFILPISFFSIFASVFGRPNAMTGTSRIAVAVSDQDHSERSAALIRALEADSALRVVDSARTEGAATDAPRRPIDPERAKQLVRGGSYAVALIIPQGWGATFPRFDGSGMPADLYVDPSDPVARAMFVGTLQRAGARVMRGEFSDPGAPAGTGEPAMDVALVRTRVENVVGDQRRDGRMIAFYAAGIAVMFLLFSASSAGGTLLDEQDTGTLERVLNTNVGMTGLLAGKWVHIALLGVVQITVMFLWGMLVFHLDLVQHLPGFLIMTVATAAAAAGFGLVLATLCRTRQQLGGLSTIVILTMSAMGGSMFPRFLMSPGMQKIGLVTFNAWALDGYIKVFWRQVPLIELWPQLLVLAGLTATFLVTARLLARRWETA